MADVEVIWEDEPDEGPPRFKLKDMGNGRLRVAFPKGYIVEVEPFDNGKGGFVHLGPREK